MEERNRRPSKAELEEDQFLEWVLNAVNYVKARAQLFIGGGVALVAVVVMTNFVQGQRVEARSRAASLLFDASIADQSGQVERVLTLAQQLVDEYAGTPSAAHGMILLANRHFALGRYADAQRLYQRYLDEEGDLEPLVFAARTGLAGCLEAQGNLGAAAAAYVAYANDNPDHGPSSIALMDAARCYRLLGDSVQHRAALERVTREYSDTPVAQRAREQLSLL
jgi:TolA-binding protein